MYKFSILWFLALATQSVEVTEQSNACLLLIPACIDTTSNETTSNEDDFPDTLTYSAIDYHPLKHALYWTSLKAAAANQSTSDSKCKLYSLTWPAEPIDCRVTRDDAYLTSLIDEAETRDNISIASLDEVMSGMSDGEIAMMLEDDEWSPRSLAVDYVNDKLYLADTSSRSILVTNLDGQSLSPVFTQPDLTPLEILLDPPLGLMFILAQRHTYLHVYRANMDGSEATLLFDRIRVANFTIHGRYGFALDTAEKRVYFSNLVNKTVEGMDYDGEGREPVVLTNDTDTIAVFNRRLYGLGRNSEGHPARLCDIGQGGTLISCEMNGEGHCDRREAIYSLKVYDTSDDMPHRLTMIQQRSVDGGALENPCEKVGSRCGRGHCLLRREFSGRLGGRCV